MKKLIIILILLLILSVSKKILTKEIEEIWTSINNNLSGGVVKSIAIDYKNSNIIYAGTDGNGLFISKDGGENWNKVKEIDRNIISKIVIDKKDNKYIYIATERGIYKSINGGETWFEVINDLVNKEITSIIVDNHDNNILYFTTNGFGVFKSLDKGETCISINNGITDMYIKAITIDPKNNNTLYVGTMSGDIFKTIDGGNTWFKLENYNENLYNINSIFIDPENSYIIYLATLNGLYKTIDGGKNWTGIIYGVFYDIVKDNKNNKILACSDIGLYLSLDNGNKWIFKDYNLNLGNYLCISIDVNNNNIIYIGTDCGIIKSYDGGESVYLKNKNLLNLFIWKISVDPKDSKKIYIGTFRNGIYKSNDEGLSWENISKGLKNLMIRDILIDPNNSNIIYIGTNGGGVYKSIDGGKTWLEKNVGINRKVFSLLIDPKNSNIIYAATIVGIYKSINGGELWLPSFSGLPKNTMIYTMTIDKNNTNILYCGDSINSKVYKSIDGGNNWVGKSKGLNLNGIIKIFIDPNNSNILYVCGGNYFYKSLDAGENWIKITEFFDYWIYDMTVIKKENNENIIYLTTDGGILKSTDDGKTWNLLNKGLEKNIRVWSLTIDPNNNEKIYIGTYGCGIYKMIKLFKYTISVNFNKGGIINPSGLIEIYTGESKTFTITPDKGYKIKDVLIDGKSVGPVGSYTFENVQEDHTIEAIFEPLSFVINTSAGVGGIISPSGKIEVKYGESKTFTITPDKGYRIKDVLIDGKSVGPVGSYTFENVQEDHTIEAIFEPLSFVINALAGLGGTISPSGKIEVKYGESKTFVITPDKGYKIKDVLVDGKSVGSVESYTFKNIEDNHKIEVIFEKEQIVIKLQIGSKTIYVNDVSQEIDVAPTIVEGRTYLPIRYVVEPLGAEIAWDSGEKKITILFKDKIIELWIGKNVAKVNGNYKFIDPNNPKVVPLIIQGRTMLPIRFVAENLGCKVDWDANTKTITIIYPGE